MKVNDAKDVVRGFLDTRGISYARIIGRTVDFLDLARDSCIFVTVQGWEPAPVATEIEELARSKGFRVDFRQ